MLKARTRVFDFHRALTSLDILCEKYQEKGKDTWKRLSPEDHLDHAKGHLESLLLAFAGEEDFVFEDLQSLAFRALAALSQTIEEEEEELEGLL